VNCTVKNNPACESLSDHREIKRGKIGPTITVGMPVRTKPAASKASSPFLFVSGGAMGMVVATEPNHSEGARTPRQRPFIDRMVKGSTLRYKAVTLAAKFRYAFSVVPSCSDKIPFRCSYISSLAPKLSSRPKQPGFFLRSTFECRAA
jgi:hypothetical protein